MKRHRPFGPQHPELTVRAVSVDRVDIPPTGSMQAGLGCGPKTESKVDVCPVPAVPLENLGLIALILFLASIL